MLNPMEITKLRDDKEKYESLMTFIETWWETLTIEEMISEIIRIFNLKVSKENLETFRLSRGLDKKGRGDASRRKGKILEINERLARAVFLEFYDMNSFLTVDEQALVDKKRADEAHSSRDERDMEKYGRVFRSRDEQKRFDEEKEKDGIN